MHEGELVPSVLVLSHSEQLERLRGSCPEAVDAALIAGDPCFDRMLASLPLRETYRRSLGVRPEQRLVMVSSTWGESSLFGTDPSLVARLAMQLPLDEYRVVVALHPNIWYGHSPWQIRMWLADCARAGVVVLPPAEGWRAALVAADITIGDHGSVTFYSAALGTPLLLAAGPEDAVDPASPIGRLLPLAPRLDRGNAFLPQIESTLQTHSAGEYADVTALTTSEPGASARLLRAEVYSRLGIGEPPTPTEPTAVPVPEIGSDPLHSQLVTVRLETGSTDFTATVTRYPAEALDGRQHLPAETILVTSTSEPRRRWLELAEVLLHDGPCDDVGYWVRTSLAALPGCLLGVVRSPVHGWLVTGPDLPLVRFTGPEDLGPVYAGMLHAWLRAGRSVHTLPEHARIRLGRTELTAVVEVSASQP